MIRLEPNVPNYTITPPDPKNLHQGAAEYHYTYGYIVQVPSKHNREKRCLVRFE